MTEFLRLKPTAAAFALLAVCALLFTGIWALTASTDYYKLEIGGESFLLEVAADKKTRYRGLSGREFIAPSEGMVFVFPKASPRSFFMRDCLVPIDVMFFDEVGVIVSTYTMQPEEPRLADETSTAYAKRLKHYYSQSPSRYVIELRAGTIDRLGLVQGDRVTLDTQWLNKTLR